MRHIIGCMLFFIFAAVLVFSIVIGLMWMAGVAIICFVLSFAMTLDMEEEKEDD